MYWVRFICLLVKLGSLCLCYGLFLLYCFFFVDLTAPIGPVLFKSHLSFICQFSQFNYSADKYHFTLSKNIWFYVVCFFPSDLGRNITGHENACNCTAAGPNSKLQNQSLSFKGTNCSDRTLNYIGKAFICLCITWCRSCFKPCIVSVRGHRSSWGTRCQGQRSFPV